MLALVAGCSNGKAKDKDAEATETTVPVEVQPVRRAAMVAVYAGTAPIEAHDEAVVVAKVGGEVRQIHVEEGDTVKAGQVLARLDGDRLRLEVAQSEANLRKLERDYTRFQELSEKGLVAKGTVENAKFDLDALRAAYDRARLELSYTEIRAPIAGVVSARNIKLGNTINANDPTFTVTDLDPLVGLRARSGKGVPQARTGTARRSDGGRPRRYALHRDDRVHLTNRRPADRHLPCQARGARRVAPPQARHVRAGQHRL